ncbi:hypothetical protein [Streptomyces sp. 8L]|uniref:hypothetical protein n=1 Tax=Streptomyces sp. 8L TaxID=2877242 RepID=UPI001CD77B65|nr:hypothetical protein [Streptomyces sp. 8L]MCA1217782.1 hypothetical protein [Streptomyces sp. 8L]
MAALLGAAARPRGAHDRTDPRIRALDARAGTALGDQHFTAAYETGGRPDVPTALTRTDPARLRPTASSATPDTTPPAPEGGQTGRT